MRKNRRALVTGGAGFIGSNLIELLLNEGYGVTSLDNYSTGSEKNHINGASYYNIDITEENFYENIGEFDVVFHLAAIARIQPSFNDPLRYFKVNSYGTMNIANYCHERSIPLIYAGSSSHHSGKFKNPYTFTKDIGEEIINLYQQIYGLKSSIARFYNVYGNRQLKSGDYRTLIGIWEDKIENGEPLIIYGDGTKRRDFTDVRDIVSCLLKIYEKEKYGHVFEIGRGVNYSINEIAKMFKQDAIYENDKPGEAINTLCDNSLCMELLNWEPKYNISDYINNFLENRRS